MVQKRLMLSLDGGESVKMTEIEMTRIRNLLKVEYFQSALKFWNLNPTCVFKKRKYLKNDDRSSSRLGHF